jgi:hypothetical protein
MSRCAAELDALIERSVRRDAVHVEELEGPKAECDGDFFSELLSGTREQGSDAGVEGNLPPKNAHDERSGEVAVFRREVCGQMRVKEFVAVAFACANSGEDLEGGGAGRADGLRRTSGSAARRLRSSTARGQLLHDPSLSPELI